MDDYVQDQIFQRDHPVKVTVASPLLDPSDAKPKFCLKIKIASSSRNSEDDEGSSAAAAAAAANLYGPGYRVCEYCGKEFSSGKAWGGHKRHHLKNDKDLKKSRKLELTKIHREKMKKHESKSAKSDSSRCNTIKAGDVSVSNGGTPTCCLCGKIFPSMNSLFGHMRFHPDRGWKGTQPPSSSDKHSCSSGLSEAAAGLEVDQIGLSMEKGLDAGVDLLTSLSSWPKREKRGRTLDPIEAACHLDPVEAACNLIELSRDSGRLEKQKIDDLRRRKKQESATKAFRPKHSGNPTDLKEGVELRIGTNDQKAVSFDHEWGDSYCSNEEKGKNKESDEMDDEIHNMITKKKNKKLMMNWIDKLNDSETLEGTGSYNIGCRSYDKSFPTFAEGDRAELVDYNSNVDVKDLVLPASEVKQAEEIEENGSIPMGISSFVCDICHKTFPTGQALGGHKRCHWKGPVKAPSHEVALIGEASQNTSNTEPSGEATRASDCRLSFDLNVPYIMEKGEQM
ncbi:unnamed protein product [Dovyalis caffra]|uniref:C2H2-type domain-containing protein n=1 Tax=Dovyalis caffra TaxID=77055 RepID=A0AAV1RAH8_9ROSI|nr:unnamed protein product [Dovyalis caffra]